MLGIDVHKVESYAVVLVMLVIAAIGVRVFFWTIPGIETEVTATQSLSVIAAQNGAYSREILDKERTQLPITQEKVNTVLDKAATALDTTNTTIKSANRLINHIDTSQGNISKETVKSLQELTNTLATTSGSIKAIGDQTVQTEDAIRDTAEGVAKTASAATDTAQATAKLAKDVHDPAVESVKNVQSATGDLKDVAKEGKAWVHSVLHPKWPKMVYGETKSWVTKIIGAWL